MKKRNAENLRNKKYSQTFLKMGGVNIQNKAKKIDFRTEARRLTNKKIKPIIKEKIRKNLTDAVAPESQPIVKPNIEGEAAQIEKGESAPLPSPNDNIENKEIPQEKLIMNHPAYDFSGGSYYYKKYWQNRRLYQ